jgi:hypothetical protein
MTMNNTDTRMDRQTATDAPTEDEREMEAMTAIFVKVRSSVADADGVHEAGPSP